MKRILILISLILLTGCSTNTVLNKDIDDVNKSNNEAKESSYIDTNPITIGIYQNNKLIDETYYVNYHDNFDLSFNAFFSQEKNLGSGSVKTIFYKAYNKYTVDISKYRIGYYLTFETKDGLQEHIILDPSDRHKNNPYITDYLYDGVHQKDGASYSHLEVSSFKKDYNYLAGIKLYFDSQTDEIIDPITLQAFSYLDDNDFNPNGYYRGNSSYTIKIYKKGS